MMNFFVTHRAAQKLVARLLLAFFIAACALTFASGNHDHDDEHEHEHADEHEHNSKEKNSSKEKHSDPHQDATHTKMSAALAKASGITTAIAGAGKLQQTVKLYGQALADPVRVSHIQARYPGVIRSVKATIGSQVRAGDVLASVESNESLRQYNITAPINGTIIERHANADEFTGERTLFTLVDYSQLEVDLHIFPSHAKQLKIGQAVAITAGDLNANTKIEYITPSGEGAATLVAHAALDNSLGQWTPNQALEASVTVAEIPVALMVDNRALQNVRDEHVVFIQAGDTFEIRPLELGQSDGQFTQVLSGLNSGDRYVVNNSYLLKADLEKSGASHEH